MANSEWRICLATSLLLLSAEGGAGATLSYLTIKVGGDLLKHGGVVSLYPIPVLEDDWPTIAGDELVQACTIADEQWPDMNARWWRAVAEQRLERLRDRALRRCYDSSWFGGGTCEPDPESDEPAYLYKSTK